MTEHPAPLTAADVVDLNAAGVGAWPKTLARRTYRRHRLQDAARLLPVLGVLLLFGPLAILASEPEASAATSTWMSYFFAIWMTLIGLAALLARALAAKPTATSQPQNQADER